MYYQFKWLIRLLSRENIKAIIGSLKRRIFKLNFLEMRIDFNNAKIPSQSHENIAIKVYSSDLEKGCISLLNSVGSLGFWDQSRFHKEILNTVDDAKNDIFVVSNSGSPIGFAVLHKKSLSSGLREVGYIAVRPENRSKRLGYKLIIHILIEMKKRGIYQAYLRTDSFRIPAIKTYLKCGFHPYIKSENEKKRWQSVIKATNDTKSSCIKVLLNPKKIHKLKLTNRFKELALAYLRIIFGRLSRGGESVKLEEAFKERFHTKRAIIFPHARTALHFILNSMNFEKGSEVLMTPLTIADMVNSIHTLGLKPVFVDIELDTFCFEIDKLKRSITPKTKAMLVTYIFGIVPDIEKIQNIAREHGLKIIEDCSQCFDASYKGKKIGTFGDAAFFSLTNFKVCSSLFGGMIITNDEKLADQLNKFRDNSLLPARGSMLLKLISKDLIYSIFFSRWLFSYFTYFVILILERIDPKITYRLYSGNIKVILGQHGTRLFEKFPADYLMDYTDVQADVGLASLARAKEVTDIRIRNGEMLRGLLQGVSQTKIPIRLEEAVNVYWRFPIISNDMDGLKRFLLKNGIDSAPTYLALCSSEPGFEPYHASMPNSERVKKSVLVVEVNEELSEDAIRWTALLVRSYFKKDAF
jgi:dTDP-4-amino-4,6-dideoxygalactose transaminase/N-acetylglutamate synthase-like GNAT family acetyltransferase